MGLLDDLLGPLSGDPSRPRTEPAATGQRSEPDMAKVMMALLPVVLGMLTSGQRDRSATPGRASGGGPGDVLGQLLGGATQGSGGLGALLEQLQRAGFGDQARSWVGTGRNEPISPDALARVFGRGVLAEIARRAGVSDEDASRGLASLVPEVVDRMTPDGTLPDAPTLLANVETLARRFGVA
jgi:uncharacterized protein YidB (DUF937 family)